MKAKLHPSEIDYARLAAYIDGEGHMRVSQSPAKKAGFLQINVANTDPRLMVWLLNNFGGWICNQKRNDTKWKRCFKWNITCSQARDLLVRCRKYLIIKGEQADLAIAFQATVRQVGVKGHSPETFHKRHELALQMKALVRKEYDGADVEALIN